MRAFESRRGRWRLSAPCQALAAGAFFHAGGTAAAELGPEACCDRIVAAMLGGADHGDDAAVLAVRLGATGAGTASPAAATSTTFAPFA